MPPCRRVRLTGTIRVPLPPKDAIALFTPTGERAWAPGWNPQFPSPVTDDTEPGTVFQTDHASRRSTWKVTRHDPATTIQYATTTPGDRAGLVTVACAPGQDHTTIATVKLRPDRADAPGQRGPGPVRGALPVVPRPVAARHRTSNHRVAHSHMSDPRGVVVCIGGCLVGRTGLP